MTICDEVRGVLVSGTTGPARPAGDLEARLHAAISHPDVGRRRIVELLTSLAGSATAPGRPARLALLAHLALDGPDGAAELLTAWRAARVADPARCTDCDIALEARALTALRRFAEAARVLGPVLADEGPARHVGSECDEHRAEVLAAALLPLLGAGQGERALACHRAGHPAVAGRPALLAEHLEFLRLTGNGRAAVELARRHAPSLLAGSTPADRLHWLTAAAHAAADQADAGHGDDLVTVAWPGRQAEPDTLTGFAAQLNRRADALAAAFDARNGSGRHTATLGDRTRDHRLRVVLPLPAEPVTRATTGGRRPMTLHDVLACPDPLGQAEEGLLARTLVDPVAVCDALVLRYSGTEREADARSVLARVLSAAGHHERCLAEAETAAAISAAAGDRVAELAARATAAASWVERDPRRALALVTPIVDELAAMPAGVERDAALCRARSAGVGALLALDMLDAAQRWLAGVHPCHPGQRVRVACQRVVLLRRRRRASEAADVLHAAGRLADAHGLVALGVGVRGELAELLVEAGELDDAAVALRRVIDDLPAVPDPDPLDVPVARMELARVLVRVGRFGAAVEQLEAAREQAARSPDPGDTLPTIDHWTGAVLRGLGLPAAALDRLAAAAAGFAALGLPDGVALAQRDRAAVLHDLGHHADAVSAFEAAAGARRADPGARFGRAVGHSVTRSDDGVL